MHVSNAVHKFLYLFTLGVTALYLDGLQVFEAKSIKTFNVAPCQFWEGPIMEKSPKGRQLSLHLFVAQHYCYNFAPELTHLLLEHSPLVCQLGLFVSYLIAVHFQLVLQLQDEAFAFTHPLLKLIVFFNYPHSQHLLARRISIELTELYCRCKLSGFVGGIIESKGLVCVLRERGSFEVVLILIEIIFLELFGLPVFLEGVGAGFHRVAKNANLNQYNNDKIFTNHCILVRLLRVLFLPLSRSLEVELRSWSKIVGTLWELGRINMLLACVGLLEVFLWLKLQPWLIKEGLGEFEFSLDCELLAKTFLRKEVLGGLVLLGVGSVRPNDGLFEINSFVFCGWLSLLSWPQLLACSCWGLFCGAGSTGLGQTTYDLNRSEQRDYRSTMSSLFLMNKSWMEG